jgi:carboxyl-terminal processing protease
MKKIALLLLTALLCVNAVYGQDEADVPKKAPQNDENLFETSRQLNIFNAIVKEMEMFYVDSIDVRKAVRRAIDAMLKGLDPYTEYIPEEDMDQFSFMTTGEYGGIGAYIRYREGGTVITEPFEGMPAAVAGLKAGDVIIAIDTVDTRGMTSDKVSSLLKGVPNSKMKVTIQRPGEKKPRTFDIVRKKVVVDQVAHYGVYGDKTGYICLRGFTDKSAHEVKSAFETLKKENGVTSLIIDLRDNGGGLLESAVNIVNFFVPSGKEVISVKGKASQWDKTYRTYNEPLDTLIPLVVLINGSSASASEIVAGSLQDMDRAVLAGQRSFGKGLVQSTRNLPYDGKLKVTMSKYYIPSGRCIQQLDYSHRNPDGSVAAIPDSLTSLFHTHNGRPVRDGGGIRPDFETDDEKLPAMLYYLYADRDFTVFDFVTDWATKHKTIATPEEFRISDDDYALFKTYLKDKHFVYDIQSSKALNELKEIAQFEGFADGDTVMFAALEEKLRPDLDHDLVKYESDIRRLLSNEIVKRYYYQRGEIIHTLADDGTLKKALNILGNIELYNKTLNNKQ